jgi:hypothetical protein
MNNDIIREILERKIRRAQLQYESLKNKELSIWGYKEIGFFKGVVETCEELLDVLDEMESESNAE